jgi:hypothetical protein
MLDPVEILDLQHCRKHDPDWAAKKAWHCLADATACEIRATEFSVIGDPRVAERDAKVAQSFRDMAERYRTRARILMGEEL